MHFTPPNNLDILIENIEFLSWHSELKLPNITDADVSTMEGIQEWALIVANLDITLSSENEVIKKYIAIYPQFTFQFPPSVTSDYRFNTEFRYNAGCRFLLASLILQVISLNETNKSEFFNQYYDQIVKQILQKDFYIHESLVYWWAMKSILNIHTGEKEQENVLFLIQEMRNLFQSRYVTSINYSYETPPYFSNFYNKFKISCFENEKGNYGQIEIYNARKNETREHYFDVTTEQWTSIIAKTKNIGFPTTARFYGSEFEEKGNHILEIYDANHNLFYLYNWSVATPNDTVLAFNFDITHFLVNLVGINIEELAKHFFPIEIKKMTFLQQINYNTSAWDAEFKFLQEVIDTRFAFQLGTNTHYRSIYEIKLPRTDIYSCLGQLIEKYHFGFEERVILALAMSIHLRPQVLDKFFTRNETYDRTFTQAGGLKGRFHSGFLPTLETVFFLLAGADISKRMQILNYYFGENSVFIKEDILRLEVKEVTEPVGAGQLVISNEYLEYLTTGKSHKPSYADNFPAQLLETELEWKDLFLENETSEEIKNIETWLSNQQLIMCELNLKKHLKLGYRALFYGSSGTGKTLTATLLGKNLGLEVYRVDLSMISSKWIGETTKNLARLFDMAENKNWILFFDEAEGLFGKRTQSINSSTDAHYNQEVGYLLQRIENYDGVVILATNLLDSIDTAFMRRFQSLVHFPVPSMEQQLALWKNIFAEGLGLSTNINLSKLAQNYTLTASNITNVLRYATIKTLQKATKKSQTPKISMQTLTEAIEKELKKANLRESVGFKISSKK